MLIAFLSFLLLECKIVWQRPSRWTKLVRRHPRRNALLWKRHSSTQSPCVLMATHGYMSDGDPLCHSIALNLTLLPALSWSTVLPWSFSSFSLSVHPFSVPPYLCLWGYLHTFRPTHTFLLLNFREMQSPRQVIHIDIKCSALVGCQRLLLFRFSSESHGVLDLSSSSTAPMYSRRLCFV